MSPTVAVARVSRKYYGADAVARVFGSYTGRTEGSAHQYLLRLRGDFALAVRAHVQAAAWKRLGSFIAPLDMEMALVTQRPFELQLLTEVSSAYAALESALGGYLLHPSEESARATLRAALVASRLCQALAASVAAVSGLAL